MLIRPRRDGDLPACAGLAREVHAADGYPRYLPADLTTFLTDHDPYGCWVAELDGDVVGHVALTPASLPAVMELAASALSRPQDELAVVARLFVSPRARGGGAGRMLLRAAMAEAASRGRWPVLDVSTDLASAIALYESQGWTRAGQVTHRWSGDRTLDAYVYVGPKA
jgi:GNAT superfamily N-acetyltransferase